MTIDFDHQKTRDAFRLGLQSAAAAALCFVILQFMGSEEHFVGVLSAVLIVQPSIGSTVSEGWGRLLATLVGSGIGLVCLFLLPNAYSVVIALAVVMFVMNFIAGFRPSWRYGVVAAVALALADTSGDFEVAKSRAIAIGIGISVGIVVSLVVWPESAVKRAKRYRRQALKAASERYGWALQDEEEASEANDARRRFHDALSSGRDVAEASKGREKTAMQKTFDGIETLYNSIILINRVDSPLSRFDTDTISRDELIDAGRTAILSLTDNGMDLDDALADFCTAIDKVEESLSTNNLKDTETKGAASVAFALREMARTIGEVQDHDKIDTDGSVLGSTPPALKELLP